MATRPHPHRFRVADYDRMISAGVFGEDDRLELIEGEIVEMAPIGPRHAWCVNRLTRLFSERLGSRAIVGTQNPVRLGELSEPQPDLALLRPEAERHAEDPTPEGYREVRTAVPGEALAPEALPEAAIPVAEVLGGPSAPPSR